MTSQQALGRVQSQDQSFLGNANSGAWSAYQNLPHHRDACEQQFLQPYNNNNNNNNNNGQTKMFQLASATNTPASFQYQQFANSQNNPLSSAPLPQNSERTRRAEACYEPSPSKRQKFIAGSSPGEHLRQAVGEKCYSRTGSQSTCCSSCSEGPPCTRPECEDAESENCVECGTGVPKCGCLNGDDQDQADLDHDIIPVVARLMDWNNSVQAAWNPQTPRTSSLPEEETRNDRSKLSQNGVVGLPDGSVISTTPSVDLVENNFSQKNTALTTQQPVYNSHQIYPDASLDMLSGTGAIFQPSTNQWANTPFDSTLPVNCAWSGCSRLFQSPQDFDSHIWQTHIEPQFSYKCPVSGTTCPEFNATDLFSHLETDHEFNFDFNDQPLTCPAPECGQDQYINDPATLQYHFTQTHATPAHGALICEVQQCNTSFSNVTQFSTHVAKQHNLSEKDYDDDIVLETQPTKASLKQNSEALPDVSPQHQQSLPVEHKADERNLSSMEGLHQCNWNDSAGICGLVFDSESSLQDHITSSHTIRLDKSSGYRCQWEGCARETKMGHAKSGFTQRGKLERHMATHTGYKCAECKICGQTFAATQSLAQHMNLHTGKKPWKCKYCDKRFPQQSACTIHERTHTNDKPLECEVCGKKFSESSNLSKHRKTHGERGAHACDYPDCKRTFHRYDQLKRHRGVHSRAQEKAMGSTSAVSETEYASTKTESLVSSEQ